MNKPASPAYQALLSSSDCLEEFRRLLLRKNTPAWTKESGVRLRDWQKSPASQPKLTFADTALLQRLETKGPWNLLLQIYKDLLAKEERITAMQKRLLSQLQKADKMLHTRRDAREAQLLAFDALVHLAFAQLGEQATPIALPRGRTSGADVGHSTILHTRATLLTALPARTKPGKRAIKARFEGQLAAFIEVLSWSASGGAKAVYESKTLEAKELLQLAKDFAKRAGLEWSRSVRATSEQSKARRIHRDVKKFNWSKNEFGLTYSPKQAGERPGREVFLEILSEAIFAAQEKRDLNEWTLNKMRSCFRAQSLPAP